MPATVFLLLQNRFYILLLCYSLIISSVLGEDLSSEDDHKQSGEFNRNTQLFFFH